MKPNPPAATPVPESPVRRPRQLALAAALWAAWLAFLAAQALAG